MIPSGVIDHKFECIDGLWTVNGKIIQPDGEAMLEDWRSLSTEERDFVLRCKNSKGAKHGAEPYTADIDDQIVPLWERPEKLGFVESVGSYKIIATDKFDELMRMLIDN